MVRHSTVNVQSTSVRKFAYELSVLYVGKCTSTEKITTVSYQTPVMVYYRFFLTVRFNITFENYQSTYEQDHNVFTSVRNFHLPRPVSEMIVKAFIFIYF